MTLSPRVRYLIRFLALAYVLVLLVVPVGLILWRTFAPGFGQFFGWDQHVPGAAIRRYRHRNFDPQFYILCQRSCTHDFQVIGVCSYS